MTILKATIYSFYFFIFIQLTAIWVSLNTFLDIQHIIIGYNYFVSGILEIIGIIVFFFIIKMQKALIPKKTFIKYYFFAIISAIFYVFAQKGLNYAYDIFADTNFTNQTTYNFDFVLDKFTSNNIAEVLLLPISEELFFRGYIQNGLQKNYKPLISISVCSILFSLMHLPDIHSSYLIFFGGLISAIFYFKSNSIIPSIIFHITWNLVILIS